ncbi:hypothetical protein M430DRAFT_67986 [Amorphotheca resinae ATCC 22711]|uniref:Uncharacterized protein n=1 Tax=Amorphotheca resinae ATCC 22711 TaxID=857342 RepID=A0A2T3AVU6_AMORE|nr:hypothetical protein M430DRAFT_67986 [Amorphotheca resinae ATCC 22711]PSS12804.1 hypothetical protein M430DRAFT_67986 [Amorphotheca resinae ATCC 22711]
MRSATMKDWIKCWKMGMASGWDFHEGIIIRGRLPRYALHSELLDPGPPALHPPFSPWVENPPFALSSKLRLSPLPIFPLHNPAPLPPSHHQNTIL